MKIFNNIKIGKRFLIIFSLIVFVIISGFSYLIANLFTLKHEADSIYEIRLLSVDYLIEADRDAYQSSISISHGINKSRDQDIKDNVINDLIISMKENYEQVGTRFGKFKKLFAESSTIDDYNEFSEFDSHYKKLDAYTKKTAELLRLRKTNALKDLYFNEYAREFEKMRLAMDKLTETTLTIAKNEHDNFNTVFSRNLFISVLIIIIICIILLASGFILTKSITNPIQEGVQFALRLSSGDLTGRFDLNQGDEIGILARSLNTAADNLESLIKSVILTSRNFSEVVQQISKGNENLSQRTAEQASSLEEVASTVEEAAAIISQNADNALEAKDLTDIGSAKSKEGNTIALEAIESINEMSKSSKKMAEIISLINDISFQTNLLALNAAVEAARAGEQGRGFAVVAGEVRNLAQRSGNAAREIEDLISNSLDKVEKGAELVNKSGKSLEDIAESSITTAQIINEIATSSREQKQGIQQINSAISELDIMTQQNSSLVEETASASEEMTNQFQELLELVEKFNVREDTIPAQ